MNTEQQNKVWNSLSRESKEFVWDMVDSWANVELKDKPLSLVKMMGLEEVLGMGIFDRRMDKVMEELHKSDQMIAKAMAKCISNIKPKFKIGDTVLITSYGIYSTIKDIFITSYGVVYLVIYRNRDIRIHENWLTYFPG